MKVFKTLLFLLIANFSTTGISQEIDSTSLKQFAFMKKMYFSIGESIFQKQDTKFKLKSDYVAPWDKISSENAKLLTSSLDSIIANGSISIQQTPFSRTNLIFSSQVEAIDDLSDLFDLKLIDFNIVDSLKKPVKVNKSNSTNYGSKSGSGFKDGASFSYNYRTIKTLFQFDSKKPVVGASGTVKFEVSFPSGYEKVMITAADKGKAFSLGSNKYQVLDILDNKVILKIIDSDPEVPFNFSFVNMNSDGDKIAQIPFFELRKMNEGKEVDLFTSSESKKTMPASIYNILKSNPNITQEEFDAELDPLFMKIITAEDPKVEGEKLFGERVIMITCAGPVDNLYLYIENRELKKTFTKSL